VTASHNPEEDNGVKIVDPLGEMLTASWESYATSLANTESFALAQELQRIMEIEGLSHLRTPRINGPAITVVSGRDTRVSSPELLSIVHEGIRSFSHDR
jgi:phosphoacetylglucosamine mutase